MGITANCIKFLNYSKLRGADFSSVLMLGRQQMFLSDEGRDRLNKQFTNEQVLPKNGDFAELLFKLLGAKEIESMDYSDFEGATLIHNLNDRVSQQYKNRFSIIFDGGTLEHVFNFPVAIKNCMDMLNVGGHFISITPTNNFCGHGFYQFSPELFFTLFTPLHGFKIKLVAIGVETPSKGITNWFEVKDPKSVGARVTFSNSHPTSLMILAEKIKETETLELRPFQSDYQHIWDVHRSIVADSPLQGEKRWVHRYRRWTPEFIKKIIRRLKKGPDTQILIEELGTVNPLFFTKMDV